MASTQNDQWLPLADAAQLLGLRPETLRKQVKRGRRHGRLDNHGRWEVRVDSSMSSTVDREPQLRRILQMTAALRAAHHGPAPMLDMSARLAEREAELAEARGIAERLRVLVQEKDARIEDLQRERDKLIALVERALERNQREQAEREARPWRRWWWRRRGRE